MHAILHQLNLTDDAFLGKGSESFVYALDEQRILRIYPVGSDLAYLAARHSFYRQLAERQPAFAFPVLLEEGSYAGQPYTIEQRMSGFSFADALPTLRGAERVRALHSYLDLAASIGQIDWPASLYGELIDLRRFQQPTWTAYLRQRIAHNLTISSVDLAQDVPQFARILAEFEQALHHLPAAPPHKLVHGDYFPGNVFIDSSAIVYGVGDFSYGTLVGDPAMDLAAAISFIELVDGYQPQDTQVLLAHLATQPYQIKRDLLAIYRLYYTLFFGHCKQDDRTTYDWCVRSLNQHHFRFVV